MAEEGEDNGGNDALQLVGGAGPLCTVEVLAQGGSLDGSRVAYTHLPMAAKIGSYCFKV